ncbi:MAG: metallophosphoesterase [Armatimonadetes bacterium]|nr:metallophosphoesterase [Armatimonadota bacterium]
MKRPAQLLLSFLLAAICVSNNAPAAGVFIEEPYLNIGSAPNDGVIRLAVLWHAPDAEANWEVRYRANGHSLSATPTYRVVEAGTIPAHRVYNCLMEGFAPGEAAAYEVYKDGQRVFQAVGRAPKVTSQPFKFLVFGDCGRGRPDQKALAKQAVAEKPDFVALVGDLVYTHGSVNEYRSNFFPYYNTSDIPLMRSVPCIGMSGNHDTGNPSLSSYPTGLAFYYYWSQPLNGPTPMGPRVSGSGAQLDAFRKGAGPNYPGGANFSFDYGNSHWTVLDSNPYNNWKNPELRAWLESDLKASSSATWKFVAFHHPPFHSSHAHQMDRFMRSVVDLIEKYHVDVVWCGHVHNYQRSFPMHVGKGFLTNVNTDDWQLDRSYDGKGANRPNGTIYIVDGAGGAEIYNPEQENDPSSWQPFTTRYICKYSFTSVSINGNRFTARQIAKDGRELDSFIIQK